MNSNDIRKQFISFFESKNHTYAPSSPVVPLDDPTLMFANAGMNQFKDVFLGTGKRDFTRAANSQKCIRAGGKHNDLDDVGQDTYHHTYFEMLGNWSFGDYFKTEAIDWAWELLTEVWGIEKDRLHATYFEGDPSENLEPDHEARDLWLKYLPEGHVHPGNKKDNFWEMGASGPCGPCSELHIDLTNDKSGARLVNEGDAEVIEIWNLVFIQYNRDNEGNLSLLPAKHVDTGMGFERICAVLQNQKSNYDTDVFTPIFDEIQKITGVSKYKGLLPGDELDGSCTRDEVMIDTSYRVLADHLRCLTFAITDGAIPSNDGRGSVLRRILRRAVRYGKQYMNMQEPFMYRLVDTLIEQMRDVFPELVSNHNGQNVQNVKDILKDEESSFFKNIDRGIRLFDEAADYARTHHHGRITGEDAFRLHDTFGFPIDLTELMAEEQGLTIDIAEYERMMEEARETARSGGKETVDPFSFFTPDELTSFNPTDDLAKFKEEPVLESSIINCKKVNDVIVFVTNETCFYAEQGGQVSDTGTVTTESGKLAVDSVQRKGDIILHVGRILQGTVSEGQTCQMEVSPKRHPVMQNHTATHLLNWSLREVLGDHINQKGSLVDADKTRFDLSHNASISDDELNKIEDLVLKQISDNHPVYTMEADQEKARQVNSLRAVFGEKYPDRVRVVSIGGEIEEMLANPSDEKWMQYSVEFCGGTHLPRTGEIESFVLSAEEAVAKGIRRVIGHSGQAARDILADGKKMEAAVAVLDPKDEDFNTKRNEIQNNINEKILPVLVKKQVQNKLQDLTKEAKKYQKESDSASSDAMMDNVKSLLEDCETVTNIAMVVGEVPHAPVDSLRSAIDWIRNKTDASAVLLIMKSEDRVVLLAGMSKDVVAKGVKAGDLIKEIAPVVGGKGGGRPDMAQGGGTNTDAVPDAIQSGKNWIRQKLSE